MEAPVAPITTQEAADLLGVSARRVRALIQSGRLPATKYGRDYLINNYDLAAVQYRSPGRPRKEQTPATAPAPKLPTSAAILLQSLSTNRETVATVYRRLNWTRQQLQQTISTHHDALTDAGLRLHVATHADASGRRERYIEIAGKRYSALSHEQHHNT